eukprot:jgi/Orpsp1_1/1177515/evm.model.c7180000061741.1
MSKNINKGISVIQSSFVSSDNNGLINDKEIKLDVKNKLSNSEKGPLIIPSSFIQSSESNSNNIQLNIENKDKNKNNLKNKNVKKDNLKKLKSKAFKGFLTRILKEEYNKCPINECWLILNPINNRFHELRLSKNYLKECYIGRNERNHLQIRSDLISGLHCKIFY